MSDVAGGLTSVAELVSLEVVRAVRRVATGLAGEARRGHARQCLRQGGRALRGGAINCRCSSLLRLYTPGQSYRPTVAAARLHRCTIEYSRVCRSRVGVAPQFF